MKVKRGSIAIISLTALLLTAQQTSAASPVCAKESFSSFPDVTINSVTQETASAPHCKIAGVIGPEIHFELLLPENASWDDWMDEYCERLQFASGTFSRSWVVCSKTCSVFFL